MEKPRTDESPGRPDAGGDEIEIEITEVMINRAADELWFFSGIDDHAGRRSAARAILLAAIGQPIDHDAWLSS